MPAEPQFPTGWISAAISFAPLLSCLKCPKSGTFGFGYCTCTLSFLNSPSFLKHSISTFLFLFIGTSARRLPLPPLWGSEQARLPHGAIVGLAARTSNTCLEPREHWSVRVGPCGSSLWGHSCMLTGPQGKGVVCRECRGDRVVERVQLLLWW